MLLKEKQDSQRAAGRRKDAFNVMCGLALHHTSKHTFSPAWAAPVPGLRYGLSLPEQSRAEQSTCANQALETSLRRLLPFSLGNTFRLQQPAHWLRERARISSVGEERLGPEAVVATAE